MTSPLVIQTLPGIGDLMWFLPHMRALARRSETGKIILLTHPRTHAHQLLGQANFIEKILMLEAPLYKAQTMYSAWHLSQVLRAENLEEAWVLHPSNRYAFGCAWAGIPKRYGYGVKQQQWFLNQGPFLPKSSLKEHILSRANNFFNLHQIPLLPEDYTLPLRENYTIDLLKGFPKPWVALGVGSSEANRCWPESYFAKLTANLSAIGTIFLCGAAFEAEKVHRIAHLASDSRIVPLTTLSLMQTAHMLAQCAFMVGNDSGLMNIAACVKVPTWGLFGPSAPLHYTPYLHAITPPSGNSLAMESITVEHVLNTLKENTAGIVKFITNK